MGRATTQPHPDRRVGDERGGRIRRGGAKTRLRMPAGERRTTRGKADARARLAVARHPPMQVQDHHDLPKLDHRSAPSRTRGAASVINRRSTSRGLNPACFDHLVFDSDCFARASTVRHTAGAKVLEAKRARA